MRRNLALIAAAITTFTLVVLVSVVYAYSGLAATPSSAASGPDQSVKTIQIGAPANAPSNPANVQSTIGLAASLSPQAAASLAAQFLHRTDLYSAELSTYNGTPAYKITFSSGDVVYVSLSGQILGVVPLAPATAAPYYGSGGGHYGSGSGYSGSHEDGSSGEHETDDGGG